MPGLPRINLRLFAKTDELTVANELLREIVSMGEQFGEVHAQPLERYWKIPEYHEVGIEFHPVGEAMIAYECVLTALASGWERHGSLEEPCAVWNPSAEGTSLSPLVMWMSLDLVTI